MEQTTMAKLGLHIGNMKYHSQNRLVKYTYTFTIFFPYIYLKACGKKPIIE